MIMFVLRCLREYSITKSIIDNINTIDDITNLKNIVGFLALQECVKPLKHRLYVLNDYYINYVELLDYNWNLIRTVYHKSGRDLIKEMKSTNETDLFKYMSDTYRVKLVEPPKILPSKEKDFIRRVLKVEDSNSRLEEGHIEIYQISKLLECCTRIDKKFYLALLTFSCRLG